MALHAVYKQFLAAPSSAALAPNAALHYITTVTSFYGPTDIIKHLSAQRNQIKKEKDDIINVVEGHDALAVQTELSLEFQDNGGAYLPGLDDQFLYDRVVHIPVLHIVKFDSDGKITSIQQSWDQGALLKQLDVIGKTGRNWPIRDSMDQIKLIIGSNEKPAATASPQAAQRSRENSTHVTRDPHATLHGLSPRGPEPAPAVSPYSGSRPRQRTFEEILGDEPHPDSPEHQSPTKVVAPKIGAGKNFQPSRLFDKPDDAPPEPDSPLDVKSPPRYMKPHPTKYNHFDFADGSDPSDAPQPGMAFESIKSKHRSQWDFEDFVTPEKAKPGKTIRNQNARNWEIQDEDKAQPLGKPLALGRARPGAGTQIERQDDGEDDRPSQRAGARSRGAMQSSGSNLYKNHQIPDDGSEPVEPAEPAALGNITNMKQRNKAYAPHFDMADNSPTPSPNPDTQKPGAGVPEDRQKAVKMMQSNWSAYDESPVEQKENQRRSVQQSGMDLSENGPNHRIKLGGDGMGNPKGGRGWSLGDDSDEEQQQQHQQPVHAPGRKGAAQKAANNFWEF
ncbi:hypothetical protein BD289DRAFT_429854 [Coniella lustricola]|uniref:NTF2 domain-containing protein n=1 Tax=Coniella lustricola TaxID=2025994 RepID=A0A2T3ACG1_9PEZI|nr:hypothetical protein BD289DRAFT_429854 [Coniella lustricola]